MLGQQGKVREGDVSSCTCEPANLFSTATDTEALGTLKHMVLIKACAGQ